VRVLRQVYNARLSLRRTRLLVRFGRNTCNSDYATNTTYVEYQVSSRCEDDQTKHFSFPGHFVDRELLFTPAAIQNLFPQVRYLSSFSRGENEFPHVEQAEAVALLPKVLKFGFAITGTHLLSISGWLSRFKIFHKEKL
jgi:hypothetical protein